MRLIKLLLKGLLVTVPLALLLITVNYRVDGSAVLRGDKFELEVAQAWLSDKAVGNFTNAINERSVMRLYVENLNQPLDTLVLGSSRAMQITAASTGAEGYFFNAGMTGADRKDILSTFYLFDRADKLPENLVIAVDPWIFFDSEEALNFRSDDNLYREFLSQRLGMETEYTPEDQSVRRKALTSPAYFQENIQYFYSDHSEEERPTILANRMDDLDEDIRLADGTQWYSASVRNASQDQVDHNALEVANVDYAQLYGFTDVDEELLRQFQAFISYAVNRGVNVTLVLTPFHPIYWDMLSVNPDYSGVQQAEQAMRNLAAQQGVLLVGSYNPTDANVSNEDFYDGLHIRRESICKYYDDGKKVEAPEPVQQEITQDAEQDSETERQT